MGAVTSDAFLIMSGPAEGRDPGIHVFELTRGKTCRLKNGT
jgi:hypothetical protein